MKRMEPQRPVLPDSAIPPEFKRRDKSSLTAEELKEIAGYWKKQEAIHSEEGKRLERKITVLEAKAGVYEAMGRIFGLRSHK